MRKPTCLDKGLVVIVFLLSIQLFSQNLVPFAPRYDEAIKGDILLIGNSNVGIHVSDPYNGTNTNDRLNAAVHVDIDGDATTFNSSSADLDVPNDVSCYQIVYAGLYWSAVVNGSTPMSDVKFKVPGGSYVDITGTEIYFQNAPDNVNSNTYAYYHDVTSMLAALPDPEGTYSVANISSMVGPKPNSEGLSAGWSLFVIYEDPLLPSKYITSFDGFTKITSSINETFPVSGFKTIPTGPVRAKYAFSTIEGDRRWTGDYLLLNGTTVSATNNAGTVIRQGNNFFNSTSSIIDPVTNTPELLTARNPNGSNTLGFDSGIINIPNPGNSVIANGATTASISLGSNLDIYYFYFNAFAIEIIAPNIVLTKIVEDEFGNDIGGQIVDLGDQLYYTIGFQNTGNDDATDLTIRDILPTNIVFNYPADIEYLAPGVTVDSYNATTREIIFRVNRSVVEENDPVSEIRFKVTVVSTCSLLSDACSNNIDNQAYATYKGTINPDFTISDDPSYNSNTGCLLTPGATNFLADLNDCTFEEEVVLCGASTVLTAGNGYDAYSWSTSPTGTPVIGTTQSITVTTTGTYYVHNTAIAPCQSTDQVFDVITFGAGVTNPVIPFADEVVICPNDGKELPNIFLCGANGARLIQTGITDTTSMIWEKLDETSCAAVVDQDCANEDDTCAWNQVTTGPDFMADTAGQYRLTLNYSGGCFNRFYFNIYTNLLVPTVTSRDIYCTTPGEIVVGGVPSGYEYSIDGINYQSSNIFSITTGNLYTVYIRQVGVTPNPCIFTVPDVQIIEHDFSVSTIITQPLCHGEQGSVAIAANDARPQYYFSISQGGSIINSVGPIAASDYTYSNLNPGIYTVDVSTDDGCVFSGDIEIIEPDLLEATSALTQPLTCTDGEITVYPVGGTPPYYYFVNSTTVFQSTPIIPVTTPGIYNITVVDSNNCSADTSITVDQIDAPDFNITKTDILCSDAGNVGIIDVNVTNANGNSIQYSIDNGVTFVYSSTFTGLAAGSYEVIVQYTTGTDVCTSLPQTIDITTQTAIDGTATLTSPYTCSTNGVITVSGVSGGAPPYGYSIDGINFQPGLTFSGLTDGTYSVTIRDANSCTFIVAPITIDALDPPTDLDFTSSLLTCPTNTSTVTITGTTGGIGTLEYQITAPAVSATPYQTSNVFAGLAPGTYTFQVRDANDCLYSESYTIDPLPTLSVVGQTLNDITCFGALDGNARFTVSGTTSFTYTINGGASTVGTSPIDLTGLATGSYTIVITDDVTNCTATASVNIDAPTAVLAITTTVSPITCIADGSVIINATDGWGGYTYSITLPDATVLPVQGSNTFSNLTQIGTYTATATDARGCIVTDTFTLNAVTIPTAIVNTASDYCYDVSNGASLEVIASGGQTPYEYSVNGGPFVLDNTFNNLTPGNYDIIVRDAYGCTVTIPTETIAAQLAVNTVLTKDIDCTISPDAVITGTISGGYLPYTYEVSFNGGGYTSLGVTGTPFTYSTSADGTYQFQITDAQGCTVESSVQTINAITLPEITSVTQTQFIQCHGDTNAAIQIAINNAVGTPAFTINVNNDTTGTDYGTQTSGLPAGDYTITLTDSKSCVDTETITITEPNAISFNLSKIDITCDATLGSSLGEITIENVLGGTAPFTYYITNNFGDVIPGNPYSATAREDHTFTIINFGTYTVNAVDANGCSFTQQIIIASPPSDLDIDVTTTVPDCTSGGTAQITAISALGSGNYEFGILEFNTTPYTSTYVGPDIPGGSVRTFTNLTPGVLYTFVVHDITTDCYFVKSADAPIAQASTLTSTVVPNNVVCQGENNGSVTFTIDNFDSTTTSVDYTLHQAFTNTIIGGPINLPVTFGTPETITTPSPANLGVGEYYLVFTENGTGAFNGCESASAIFEIKESAVNLSITATIDNNANCNSNSGVISAIARDGTAPYLYQITTSATPPLATDPSWASANVFNRDANTYYVHVKDAYGCIQTTPVALVLPLDPEPVIDLALTNQCTVTEGNFEIDVTLTTPGVGPYSFSIDGGAFQTNVAPFTISNLSSGTHSVEVQDANGCGNLVNITIETPLGLTPAITALPTCPNNDGEITVTGSGGTGSYTYEILTPIVVAPQASTTFSGLAAGTYTVRITDTNTLCTADATVSLDAATPVVFTTTPTDVSCNGGNDGTITVNLPLTNDNPIYTYEIIAPIVVAPQTSNVFTGLAAGNYTVQVTSGRGCSNTEIVPVGEPSLLTVSGTATPYTCALDNSVNTSTLVISEVGGTSPFTYSINGTNYFGTNSFDIIDTGSVQNITIFVQDANGCIATNTVVINPLPVLAAAIVTEATPIDCNNTGSVAINVTGGSGNFSYEMLPSGTPQASNIFTVTVPGDYYFQVNDIDTGCFIATVPYTVLPYDNADVVLTPTNSVTCFGDNNGAFEINVSNYSGTYTYEVFDSSGTSINGIVSANTSTNPEIVTGMNAGNFTVVVTETASPFCTVSSNVITIDSPADPLNVVATETSNVTCDNNSGTITAIASGGWGDYEYELTGAATVGYSPSGTFAGLSAGVYTVNVRDAGGCIVSDGVTLIIPNPIDATVTANTTLLSCFGDTNASITASLVTGGQGNNYTFTLNRILPTVNSSGPQTSPIFNGLGAGTYTVTINDGYNCEFTSADIVIDEPTQIQASLVQETSLTCLTDTELTLSATGGTGAYEYSTDSSFASVIGSFASSVTFSVTPGTYQYYVRDANGCISSVSNEITIDPLPTLTVTLDATNAKINCAGDDNGVIVAIAEGGLGSYIYILQDTLGNDITPVTQDSPGVFTNLPVGNYQVEVTSGDCLVTSAQIPVTEPTNPLNASFTVTDVACNGGDDGIMEITATGGTGIIKYAISPQLNQFFETSIFTDLVAGTYQAIAQDELGCFVLFDFTIDEPTPVMLSIVPNSIIPEVCSGDLDGMFSIEISGGNLPYSVSLDDINGTYITGGPTQTQFDFDNLAGDDHIVYVRDNEGCESEWNITFPGSVLLEPQVVVEFGCVNNLSTNTVTVTVDSSITNLSDVDYSLNGGPFQASNVFTNVPAGIGHYINVRHTNGCEKQTVNFDIEQYDPLVLVLEDGKEINQIVALASGGAAPYEYTLNGEDYGNENTFLIYASGDYTVTVTDSNGCVASATKYFEYIDVCIPNYFTPNDDGTLDTWGPGCTNQYDDMTFDIFDRYGRKIATLRVGEKWDGKYNGIELPTGDYWYVVKLNDPRDNREFVGHFTLYR
jgi:gliding motility-associated-like protein